MTALLLREGRLLLPATDTNGPRQTVCLNAIDGEVRFLPGDVWDLRSLRATCRGVKARLSGTVTNASALRELAPAAQRPPSLRGGARLASPGLDLLPAAPIPAPTGSGL